MKIAQIREQSFPIHSAIRNAVIDFSEMTASGVAVVTDVIREGKPVVGYGFNSNGRYQQSGILRSRMIPRLLRAPAQHLLSEDGTNIDPLKAWRVMMTNEKPGGHGERSAAAGALDMALWDLAAKIEEKPLFRLLGEKFRGGKVDPFVYVYAAGGYYYPGKGLSALQEEIRRYLDLGYLDVKIKVGGPPLKEDLQRIEGMLAVLGDGSRLAVDANGRFDLKTALDFAEAIAPYRLKWYEEPGDPLDFQLLAEVSKVSETPLATGENLFSFQDSRNLIRYGGLVRTRDILQMDPALSYGLVEYLRILEMLNRNEWSWRSCIPHGGHQFSLHLAAGLGLGGNESYPDVFQPFGGFADETKVEAGHVRLPDVPGIGIELKADLMKLLQALAA